MVTGRSEQKDEDLRLEWGPEESTDLLIRGPLYPRGPRSTSLL